MKKITIVGSGIIGLSIAEHLSRNQFDGCKIQIISDENPQAGSIAAAANLATKGQLFGRDSHFQLKLNGKLKYKSWLTELIKESETKDTIEDIYCSGRGIDCFTTEKNREAHFKRVLQSPEELLQKKLPLNSIQKNGLLNIFYEDEAWVDAEKLLLILRKVLKQRSVLFIKEKINLTTLKNLNQSYKKHSIIFCTGAWTPKVFQDCEIKLPLSLQKSIRSTFGSTFFGENILKNFNTRYSLFEFIASNLKNKVTFSGTHKKHYISSTTIKTTEDLIFPIQELNLKNSQLLELAQQKHSTESPSLIDLNSLFHSQLMEKRGYRIGFGHKEIVIEKAETLGNLSTYVCAGAHKSGFLFAPVVGEIVQNLLCD